MVAKFENENFRIQKPTNIFHQILEQPPKYSTFVENLGGYCTDLMHITHLQLLKAAKLGFQKKLFLNPTDQKEITEGMLAAH